jgi:ribosomal protein S18 acetylase RimI-like enzyme
VRDPVSDLATGSPPSALREVSIRRAEVEDAAVLAELARRTFVDTYATGYHSEDVHAYVEASFGPDTQADEIRDPRTVYLLAAVAGRLAGYVQLRAAPPPDGMEVDGPMEIARFYVAAEWHGHGVAGEMMRACAEHAVSSGARSLWLCVWKRNARAIRFYQKCGFTFVGEMDFTMGDDVQRDHVMARRIA